MVKELFMGGGDDWMEEQRRILEQMIESEADYSDIVRQSQKLDKLIVAHMRGGENVG